METLLGRAAEDTVLHAYLPHLVAALEWLAALIDLGAVAILLIGAIRFAAGFVRSELRRDLRERTRGLGTARLMLAIYILSGLELFIVSDVIRTALSLAFTDLLFLLMLVIIRSIVSFFLDREMNEIRRDLSD